MSFKILSGLLNSVRCKRLTLGGDIGKGDVGVHHGMTFSFGSAIVCLPAIFETCLSHDKDIWIAADYCMFFYIIVLIPLTSILQLLNFTASYFLVY